MIITCISECNKAAYPRTQRILSKYLPQIGRRTWQGRLSQEGVADMIDALKNDIHTRHKRVRLGKNAAIAIYRNSGYDETRLITIVGNRRVFSDEGHYCFSVQQASATAFYPALSQNNQLLRACVRLAGLWHDLGKATVGFQHKLSHQTKQSDPIRHEAISWALLAPLLRSSDNASPDRQWLQQLSTADGVKAYFSNASQQVANYLNPDVLYDLHLDGVKRAPLLYGLTWLILSHHRLPAAQDKFDAYRIKNDIKKGFQPNLMAGNIDFLSAPAVAFLTFDHKAGLPWLQDAWLTAVVSCITKIQTLLTEGASIYPSAGEEIKLTKQGGWFSALYHHLRPLLVTADYLASADKQLYQETKNNLPLAEQLFANRLDNQWADSLTSHLLKVSHWSYKLFNQLTLWQQQIPSWQTIERYALPERLNSERIVMNLEEGKANRIHGDSRFRWQQALKVALVKQRFQLEKNSPDVHLASFGVMVAETGSGKTIAAISALAAVTGRVRITTALGFRSLTRQTAKSYRNPDDVGLKPFHVAALIGTSLEKEFEKQDKLYFMETTDGVENSPQDITEYYWDSIDEQISGDRHPITTLGSRSLQPMLETPVVVATTDHLVHALEGSRAAQLLPIYRIATSDTILDELDSYQDTDLISLGRWAYVCGYYGRSLWLVSATLPSQVAMMFAKQYYTGLQAFEWREHKQVRIINGLAANRGEQQVFTLSPNELTQFSQHYQSPFLTPLLKDIIDKTAEFARHQYCFIASDEQNLAVALTQQIEQFHQTFAYSMTLQGQTKRISIGAVMLDTVAHTQQMAINLSKIMQDRPIMMVCYHARYTLLDRLLLERMIEPLLNRKSADKWQQALLDNPDILSHLTQHDELIIIVCTTNILETGRDFDFDWACSDLLSVRSLIQLAGRVKRHRMEKTVAPNMALFKTPHHYARELMGHISKSDRIFTRAYNQLLELDNDERLGELYPTRLLHSAPLLNPAQYTSVSTYFKFWHEAQAAVLNNLDRLSSQDSSWLNNSLATEYRFRKGNKSELLLAYSKSGEIWQYGAYSRDIDWYQVDFLPTQITLSFLQDAGVKKTIILKDKRLSNSLGSLAYRAQLWQNLNLANLPETLLHHIQYTCDKKTCDKGVYSSDLGLVKEEG